MRIRSPLTESNLYRCRRVSLTGSGINHPVKHVFRLLVLLVLVLLLMQRAGNPLVYQRIFSQLGIVPPTPVRTTDRKTFSPSDATRDMKRLAQFLTDPQLRELTQWLLNEQLACSAQNSKTKEPSEEMLQEHQVLVSDLIVKWQADAAEVATTEPVSAILEQILLRNPLGPQEQTTLNLFATAIDGELLRRMEAFQLLKHGPLVGEAWLATRGLQLWETESPEVGTLPLLQQAVVYRAKWLQIRGAAMRVDRIEELPFGTLYRIWLNPADGSKRPVIVSCLNSPKSLVDAVRTEATNNGVNVVAQGWFATSATYAAVGGVETAPLLIGHVDPVSDVAPPPPTLTEGEVRRRLLIIALTMAAIAGLGTWRIYTWTLAKDRIYRLANADRKIELPNNYLLGENREHE